jgi:GNAT superfamily N-acetyltransferase
MNPLPAAAEIRQVTDHSRRAALARLAIGGVSPGHADEVMAFARRMGIDLDLMWAAHRGDGRLGAVVLIVPQTGRTGMFFTSTPSTPSAVTELAATIDIACREAPLERVKLGQALVSPEDTSLIDAFEAAKFWRLAALAYMQCKVPRRVDPPLFPPTVTLETYREDLRSEFMSVLEDSYRHTLDCPGLRGLRDTGDVIEGHKSTGKFEPAMWTLVRIEGRPAAVLLLNPVPAAECVELVYLGISPEFRGRGLGTLLVSRAMQLCSERNERLLTLAVDEHNEPALRLYKAHHFKRTMRRIALIRDCAKRS